MRPDVPASAGSAPSSGAKALGDDHRAHHIDLDLPAKLVDRQIKQRAGDGDAGIVDETRQCLAVLRGAYLRSGSQHSGLIRDIEQQRDEVRAELSLQALRIDRPAHAAEHAKTAREQKLRRGMADARGDAGDDDGSHDRFPGDMPSGQSLLAGVFQLASTRLGGAAHALPGLEPCDGAFAEAEVQAVGVAILDP